MSANAAVYIKAALALTLVTGTLPGHAAADSTDTKSAPKLTLKEAILRTMQANPLVLIQKAQLSGAKGSRKIESSAFDVNSSASYNGGINRVPLDSITAAQAKASKAEDHSGSLGGNLNTLLRSGQQLDLTALSSRQDDDLLHTNSPNASSVFFTLRQPLFRGRDPEAVTALEDAAKIDERAQRHLLLNTLAQQIQLVVTGYWNYLAAYQNLQILKASEQRGFILFDSAKKHAKSVAASPPASPPPAPAAAGAVPASAPPANAAAANLAIEQETVLLEATVYQRTSARIDAELQMDAAKQALGLAMGLEGHEIADLGLPSDSFPVVVTESQLPKEDEWHAYEQDALTRRRDMLASEEQVKSAELRTYRAKNDLLPTINVGVRTGYNGLDEGSSQRRYFSSFADDIEGWSVTGLLQYNFPLQNNYAKGSLLQAKALHDQAKILRDNTQRNVVSGVWLAFRAIESNVHEYVQSRQGVTVFQAAYNKAEKLFMANSLSAVDALSIDSSYTLSYQTLVKSQRDYAAALAALRYATGTLLERDEAKALQEIEMANLNSLPAKP